MNIWGGGVGGYFWEALENILVKFRKRRGFGSHFEEDSGDISARLRRRSGRIFRGGFRRNFRGVSEMFEEVSGDNSGRFRRTLRRGGFAKHFREVAHLANLNERHRDAHHIHVPRPRGGEEARRSFVWRSRFT